MKTPIRFILCFMITLIIIPGAFAENRQPHDSSTTPVNNSAVVSASSIRSDENEAQEILGELQVGRAKSVILYIGMDSGDYAGYCFTNDSEAGRAILAACKNKGQCKVKATVEAGECEVPGLEATLSASFTIVKVQSAKAVRRRK